MSEERFTIQIHIVTVDDAGEVVGDAIETFGPTWASDDLDAIRKLADALDNFCNVNFKTVVGEEHTSSLWPDLIHKTPRYVGRQAKRTALMANRYIIRVEVLAVTDNVVDPDPIIGFTTDYACSDLDETVGLCEDLRLMANAEMNNGKDFIKSRVTPFVNVREEE